MSRIAWLSPLPPERTGIADYSRDVLVELARLADVEAYAGARADPIPGVRVRRARGSLRRVARDDAVVAQVGNSLAHDWILDWLHDNPAVVALHELVLHHVVAAMTVGRGRADRYVDAMGVEAGPSGRLLAHAAVEGLTGPLWEAAPERYPLTHVALRHATGVVVHSRFSAEHLRLMRPGMPVDVVPLPAPPPLGVAPERLPGDPFPVIGVFGFVTPHKRLPVVVRAFARLRAAMPRARLLVVGSAPPALDPARLAADAGLPAEALELVGFADGARFEALMRATDVGVALRHPTLGETSAVVVRMLGLGVPVCVSTGGWYDELPDDAVARIPPGRGEADLLAAVLARLARDESLRRGMSEAGREHAERALSPRATADAYLRALLAPRGRERLREELLGRVAARLDEVTTAEARRRSGVMAAVGDAMRSLEGL